MRSLRFQIMILYLLFSMAVVLEARPESGADTELGARQESEANTELGGTSESEDSPEVVAGPEMGAETEFEAEPTDEELLLLSAIKRGDKNEVSRLLNVVDINTYIYSATPILCALEFGKVEIAESLIENDKLIVDKGNKRTGETALLAAIRFEVYSCVPLLLEKKASIHVTGRYDRNVLHYVAIYGGKTRSMDETLNLLDLLLKKGASHKDILHGRDYYKRTPLLAALAVNENFKPEVVKKLMNANSDVMAKDEYDSNALHYACRQGDDKIVNRILDTAAEGLINEYNTQKLTPLLEALTSQRGRKLSIVVSLVQHGEDHIKPHDPHGRGPLHLAVASRSKDIMSYLLNLELTDPCQKDNSGQTAITIAAMHCDKDMMNTLLKEGKGCDKCVDGIDNEGKTPLMRNVEDQNCQLGIAEILVKAGARLQITDSNKNSILHHAARNCKNDALKFLVQKVIEKEEKEKETNKEAVKDSTDDKGDGAVVRCKMLSSKNNLEETPLMTAMSTYSGRRKNPDKLRVVKTLVESGAPINATNIKNESALRYAVKNYYSDCALYLLEQKADATILDADENTLFHVDNPYIWTKDLVQALVKAGTPLNALNKEGETAITYAMKEDFHFINGLSFYSSEEEALYEYILEAGEDVNKANLFEEVPLQIAVDHGHGGLVKLFLRCGANTEVRNSNKDTPVLSVVKRNQLDRDDRDVFEALINAKADLYAKDANQCSAIEILSSATQLPEYVIQILRDEKEKNEKKQILPEGKEKN